jgi:hypothetical protein
LGGGDRIDITMTPGEKSPNLGEIRGDFPATILFMQMQEA